MNLEYRPDDPAFLADPFPMFRRMQHEDPCHWSTRLKAWVLTRYEDVRHVCLDKDMSSDRLRPYFATLPPTEAQRIAELMRYLTLWMVFRDPRAYEDPDRVDIARNGPPHLAFGFGLHICLGFPLARLEGQIALPAVLAHWPGIEVASGHLEWLNSMVFRGMKAMPVRVRA
jgi:cytochrome P450